MTETPKFTLAKRPVAFRIFDQFVAPAGRWILYMDERDAREHAKMIGHDYQGLYVRDETPLVDAPSAEVAGERKALGQILKTPLDAWHFENGHVVADIHSIARDALATPPVEPPRLDQKTIEACAAIFDLRATGEETKAEIHKDDLERAARYKKRAANWRKDAAAIRALIPQKAG